MTQKEAILRRRLGAALNRITHLENTLRKIQAITMEKEVYNSAQFALNGTPPGPDVIPVYYDSAGNVINREVG